ncbi:hypothetical protein BH10ACI2_BH10ACI2_11700 [soil metagenome]
MRRFFLAILIVVTFSNILVEAQVCGGGARQYEIFVKNGFSATNLRYELFTVMPKGSKDDDYEATAEYLSRTFFPNKEKVLSRFWIHEPLTVRPDVAEKFLKGYDADNFRKVVDTDHLRGNKFSGIVSHSEITFATRELFDSPMLLKIVADNYNPVYLIGDHFGGCRKTYNILLEDFLWPK